MMKNFLPIFVAQGEVSDILNTRLDTPGIYYALGNWTYPDRIVNGRFARSEGIGWLQMMISDLISRSVLDNPKNVAIPAGCRNVLDMSESMLPHTQGFSPYELDKLYDKGFNPIIRRDTSIFLIGQQFISMNGDAEYICWDRSNALSLNPKFTEMLDYWRALVSEPFR
jgi:hypothetical protein